MQTVLISGVGRGIGLELCRIFLSRGDKVIGTYRGNIGAALQMLIGPHLTLVELDVTDNVAITELGNKFADTAIDLLINNAGVIGPEGSLAQDIDSQQWLHTFHVNTIAPFQLTQALLPALQQSSKGRVMTLSSQMGSLHRATTGMVAYRTSKAAVNKAMQVLALELTPMKIAMCMVHPGWVQTDMGGADADISVVESAQGLVKVSDQLNMDRTGQFLTWQGEVHPW
ncbi:SDR family oxidoreductase [Motilimonas pumila]|uniref:SDR family oxidoreductase n=1 Tax=Motilimonas pumila TaxID=2303987 RepID=A0A418YCF4_9GAMM|nr:SDR family oxidoreductase [Motilimonas pumila]RJG42194.1 SDR family oxidoreductase [Motilimonas pumila]